MSNSVARSTAAGTTVSTAKLAKTQSQPKIGVQQAEQEQQLLSKVSIAQQPSASLRSPTTKTPPIRLTRSISSKPNVEANRRTIPKTKIHKELIRAKVKSNPALLQRKDGSPVRSSKEEVGPRRFTKRGDFSLFGRFLVYL